MTARRLRLVVLGTLVGLTAYAVGCDKQEGTTQAQAGSANGNISLSSPDAPAGVKPSLVSSPDPANLPAGSLLFIHTDLRHYEVPIGKISRNEAFWASLDQNACGAQMTALLRQNGFRVAVGANASWPALKASLEEAQALAEEFTNQNRSGVTVEYVTNNDRRNLTLFYYDQRRQLRGLDLAQVKTSFLADQAVDVRQVNMVRINILPTVRSDQVVRRWMKTADGRFEEQLTYDSLPLPDLAFQVAVPYDHFLVIAPSEAAATESLVGGRFLTRELGLERKESLFVVIPQVLRVDPAKPDGANQPNIGLGGVSEPEDPGGRQEGKRGRTAIQRASSVLVWLPGTVRVGGRRDRQRIDVES